MEQAKAKIQQARTIAIGAGVVGLGALIAGSFMVSKEHAIQSYHYGLIFWLFLALGGLGLTLLHHTVKGKWGLPLIRMFESSAMTLPLVALLFIPILLPEGMHALFEWTHEEAKSDRVLQGKAFWLNTTGFYVRFAVYFMIWTFWAYMLWKWSSEQDKTGNPAFAQKRVNFAAPGIVVFMLSATAAMTDWLMSLQPHWFSTMYGVIMAVSQVYVMMGLAVWLILGWRDQAPYKGLINPSYTRDWGNLLFTFTVFWTYVSFSQMLIQYAGNLPEEISYYVQRNKGSWNVVSTAIAVLGFFAPFLILLSPRVKRLPNLLRSTIVLILVMRAVHVYWEIKPVFSESPTPHWMDFAALVGVGGIWLAVFFTNLLKRPLLPQHEPRLQEVAHGH